MKIRRGHMAGGIIIKFGLILRLLFINEQHYWARLVNIMNVKVCVYLLVLQAQTAGSI